MKYNFPLNRHPISELLARTIRNFCPFPETPMFCFMHGILLSLLVSVLVPITAESAVASVPDLQALNQMSARFVPTPLKVDTSQLSSGDRKALIKLIQAARAINPLFMRQLWAGNLTLYKKLQEDKTPLGQARAHYFWINKSPWSDIDEHRAFLGGVPPVKPLGANFYPDDMTKDEFASWKRTLDQESRAAVEGFFTVIRRDSEHKLKYVPYSTEYRTDLATGATVTGSRRADRQFQP
jgi:hypothetical protein